MEKEFQTYAGNIKNQILFQWEDVFQANQEQFISRFREHFNQICREIVRLQKSGGLPELSYLEYTLLYTNFLERNYAAQVRVYGEDWYLDPNQKAVGTFDVSFLFEPFTELWDKLLTARKGYAGEVSSADVAELVIAALPCFYAYVVTTARRAILTCVEGEAYGELKRADEFEINIGEYMGHTEAVYKEKRNKDREEYADWFRQRLELRYTFEDLTGMDFSGEDLSEIDFRYSDLRNTVLRNTDFQDSMLFGTRFCNAVMEGADLRYCMLYEADFTGADLKHASFVRAVGDAGIQEREEWLIPGYQGVSFRNADLRNADFTKASFRGADFTGAILEGAVFGREQAMQSRLTEEQRKTIVIR